MTGPKAGSWSRRRVLGLGAAVLAAPMLAGAAKAGRVVVVGGGFGGSATARRIKRLAPALDVVLVAADRQFVCCPGSNSVIAGLRGLEAQTVHYAMLERDGVRLAYAMARDVDTATRHVVLADGARLPYDKLVLSPGISFFWGEIEGVSAATVDRVPHAWQAGTQTLTLRRQLEAMRDGGLFVVAPPVGPLRCPPAVGERISLVAHTLKKTKPKSKILVLDPKDKFALQELFTDAWKELYPGMITYRTVKDDGTVRAINPDSLTVTTDFEDIKADVVNFIPRQGAGEIARRAGAADVTGWCPVDPATFASTLLPHVHVIGDSAFAPPLPKAAAAAVSVAQTCAQAVARDLVGGAPPETRWHAGCYSLAAPDHGFAAVTDFHLVKGAIDADHTTLYRSAQGAPADQRRADAEQAEAWLKGIQAEVWG